MTSIIIEKEELITRLVERLVTIYCTKNTEGGGNIKLIINVDDTFCDELENVLCSFLMEFTQQIAQKMVNTPFFNEFVFITKNKTFAGTHNTRFFDTLSAYVNFTNARPLHNQSTGILLSFGSLDVDALHDLRDKSYICFVIENDIIEYDLKARHDNVNDDVNDENIDMLSNVFGLDNEWSRNFMISSH